MKIKITLCLIVTAITLGSCTQTKNGMTKNTLENAIEDIKDDAAKNGYYLTSENTDMAISASITSSRDAKNSLYEADLANTKANQYNFADSAGNKFTFTVAYNEALSDNTLYVLETSVINCETSNAKDNLSLCGRNSAVGKIKTIPNDKPVVIGDAAGTVKGLLGLCVAIAVGSIIMILAIF